MNRKISSSGIYRLALYSRYLSRISRGDREYISSQELAEATGHTADQVRKDLTSHGSLGEPGKGYQIGKLKKMLISIFGKQRFRNVILVGVGNLGMALILYKGFEEQKFNIAAAFDRDKRKIGKRIDGVLIHDLKDVEKIIADTKAEMAIVSVPAVVAQEVIDDLVSAGIKSILNFAPARVNVPKGVVLQNVDMSVELDRLYYLLKNPE
jgi:redox-sensing transcriptional repressor